MDRGAAASLLVVLDRLAEMAEDPPFLLKCNNLLFSVTD
jgi:hypothetical protein